MALAAVVLVGGGLLVRALDRLRNVDPGYSVDGALSFRLALPPSRYPAGPAPVAFFEGLLEELRGLPGVDAAGAVSCPPLGCHWGRFLDVEGEPPRAQGAQNPVVLTQIATEQYLEAMKTGVVAGRSFMRGDGREGTDPVVVVSETLARRIAPTGTAVGRRVRFGAKGTWHSVIGVVRNVRHDGLEAPVYPTAYLPLRQESTGSLTVVLRTDGDPQAVFAAARRVVQRLDPELPLFEVARLREALEHSLVVRRTFSWLSLVLSAVALVLATGGVYGIVSYGAARRTREMGIRVALGASRADLLRLVTGYGLRPACAGLAVGLVAALGMGRALASQLAGLSPFDPPTFAAVGVVLLGTAVAAALWPARRAASVSPQVALREE
jgi:putative ABC transport system permease protein